MLRVTRVEERLDQPPALANRVIIQTGVVRLIMMPPGTRGMPHFHNDETALYIVSGETAVWHGEGLVSRSTVRAGDFLYIPPGAPHLAVNHGDVTSVAVAAGLDPADCGGTVVLELPRHLAGLLSLPVAQS